MSIRLPRVAREGWVNWIDRIVGPVITLELVLTVAIAALAVAAPHLGRSFFARVEAAVVRVARSPRAQILVIGLLAVVARALFLPWLGPSVPISHDEHSLFLQAQTYLAGRLANPTPPLWEHFEGIHINVVPAYASMYFPGRSLPIVLGMLLNQPWLGVWISFILMCMAAVWMLQGWVRPPYAFLGGVLVVLRLGIFSYWVNSYWGGAFTALGGMLVLGAMPRVLKAPGWRNGLPLAVGAAILLITRPFEGALLCAPVGLAMLWVMLRKRGYPLGRMLVQVGVPVALLVSAGAGWTLAYNKASTGEALVAPYDLNRQTYAITPAFLVQDRFEGPQRGPAYFRGFYQWEDIPYARRGAPTQMVRGVLAKLFYSWNFYVGFILTPAFVAGLWAARRTPALLGTLGFFYAGYSFATWNFPHYTAPIFAVMLIVTMKGFEWLRSWVLLGRESGLFLTRAMPTAVALTLVMPAATVLTGYPRLVSNQSSKPCCALIQQTTRTQISARLEAIPGRDIVLVAADVRHPIHTAVLYNEPNIEAAEIVWAHRLGPGRDERLLRHFAGRRVWEVEWRGKGGYTLQERRR